MNKPPLTTNNPPYTPYFPPMKESDSETEVESSADESVQAPKPPLKPKPPPPPASTTTTVAYTSKIVANKKVQPTSEVAIKPILTPMRKGSNACFCFCCGMCCCCLIIVAAIGIAAAIIWLKWGPLIQQILYGEPPKSNPGPHGPQGGPRNRFGPPPFYNGEEEDRNNYNSVN